MPAEDISPSKLKVVLYWHMHQPDYRDMLTGVYQQPWTYLHTIKDYIDMVMHLETETQARVVINFTPILLEQIEDYALQIENFLTHKTSIRDPLLASLVDQEIPNGHKKRMEIINWCAKAHEKHTIQRFTEFDRLIKISNLVLSNSKAVAYLHDQYFFDLLVWYHLGWLGEHVRRSDVRIKRLLNKKNTFDYQDRIELLTVIGELLSSTIPRYRALAESKQIELSTTPYSHPIMPLLINLQSALEATPDMLLPKHIEYPGGKERTKWHIENGIEIFKKHFGFTPAGCWPSEGAISTACFKMLQQFGFKWIASGAGIFRNSVNKDLHEDTGKVYFEHLPNRLSDQNIICFFRDDRISDLIGFEYATWHADDAVANLVQNLKEIKAHDKKHPDAIISIILDGENAWEHYPNNGYYFLGALYKELSQHPEFELTTYSDHIKDKNIEIQTLPNIVAGSWVYGTLSTWIGDEDKNRGWDMLCDAKQCYDNAISSKSLSSDVLKLATQQLAICEGSDWFWWFGDYNSAETVNDFESLYRKNLSNLYEILNQTPPAYLSSSFTFGKGAPKGGGSMRKSG